MTESRQEILDALLRDVKRIANLPPNVTTTGSDASAFLAGKQLATSITTLFRQWLDAVCAVDVTAENQCGIILPAAASGASSPYSQCVACHEMNLIGEACYTLVSQRLSSVGADDAADDDGENNTDDTFNDATIDVVVTCCTMLFQHKPNTCQQHSAATLLLQPPVFKQRSPWRKLITIMCCRNKPLSIAVKGLRFLVSWIVGTSSSSSSSTPTIQTSINEMVADIFGSQASIQTDRVVRCASVLHESFSNQSTRAFVQATGFDQLLGALLLKEFPAPAATDDDNDDENSHTVDPLLVCTLLTSIGHVVNCCGPQSLNDRCARIFAQFLLLPAAESTPEGKTVFCAAPVDSLSAELIRPFAHHAAVDLFQRGTVGDEEQQKAELARRAKEEQKRQQKQSNNQDGAAACASSSGSSSANNVTDETSPWSLLSLMRRQPFSGQSATELINHLYRGGDAASSSSTNRLLFALIGTASGTVLRQTERDDIELWLRSSSAVLSSSFGIFSSQLVLPSESLNGFLTEFATIARAVAKNAVANPAARMIAINAMQSCAVPMSGDVANIARVLLTEATAKQQPDMPLALFDIFADVLDRLASFVGTALSMVLHGAAHSSSQGKTTSALLPPDDETAYFARVLMPLGRGSAGPVADESIQDAFWSLVEQIVVLAPVDLMQKLFSAPTNNQAQHFDTKRVVRRFVESYINKVVAPMCPSLVAMLGGTPQKDMSRALFAKRRAQLSTMLLKIEALCRSVDADDAAAANTTMICGCSKTMWDKLKDSVLIIGGLQ